jgi:hypothetical protein
MAGTSPATTGNAWRESQWFCRPVSIRNARRASITAYDRRQVGTVPIRSELDAIGWALLYLLHRRRRVVTQANRVPLLSSRDDSFDSPWQLRGLTKARCSGVSRCRLASFIAPVRNRVDEFLILKSVGARCHSQRLAMRFRPERRRAHIRHPDLDRAQTLCWRATAWRAASLPAPLAAHAQTAELGA